MLRRKYHHRPLNQGLSHDLRTIFAVVAERPCPCAHCAPSVIRKLSKMSFGPTAAMRTSHTQVVCQTPDRLTPSRAPALRAQTASCSAQARQPARPPLGVVRAAAPDAAQASAPTAEEKQRLASLGGVVTDAAVPEGHKGLHGFLYGEGGAEEHDSGTRYRLRHVRRLLGTSLHAEHCELQDLASIMIKPRCLYVRHTLSSVPQSVFVTSIDSACGP